MEEKILSPSTTSRSQHDFIHFSIGLLLWEKHLPALLELFLFGISELQIMGILFMFAWTHFPIQNPDKVSSFLTYCARYTSYQLYYDFSGEDILSLFIFGAIGIYLFLIVCFTLILLFVFYLRPNKETSLARLWSGIGIIHYNLGFLLIQQFILSLFKSLNERSQTSGVNSWPEGLVVGIVAIFMAINLSFGLLTAKFAYYPIKDGYLMACRSPTFVILGLLFKFTETICSSLLSEDSVKMWVSLTITTIFLTVRLTQYMREFPFFEYGPMRVFIAFGFVEQSQLLLNLIWTTVSFWRRISFVMVMYSHVLCAFLAIGLSSTYIYHAVWKYATQENKKLRTQNDFFKKLFALDRVLGIGSLKQQLPGRKIQNEYEFIFMDLISKHANTCLEPTCACKLILINRSLELGVLQGQTRGFELEKFYFEYIHTFFEEGISYLGSNALLNLQLAYLLIENDQSAFSSAIYLVNSIRVESQSLLVRVLRSKVLQKIETTVRASFFTEVTGLNLKQLTEYHFLKQTLRNRIAKSTKLFINFWEIFKTPTPSINKLLKLNRIISHDSEGVNQIWENLTTQYSRLCFKDYILYGMFIRTVRSAPFTSEKMFTKYFSIVARRLESQGQINKEPFLDDDGILLCVSLDETNFAKIAYVSQNVEELGYTKSELTGKSVDVLMSPFFAKNYKSFFMSQISSGKNSIMNRDVQVYVRTNYGYVQPASAYLMPSPYLQNGFYALAVLKIKEELESEYLFVLSDGKIEGASDRLSRELDLDFNKKLQLSIDEICLDSLKILRYVNNLHLLNHLISSPRRKENPKVKEFLSSESILQKNSSISLISHAPQDKSVPSLTNKFKFQKRASIRGPALIKRIQMHNKELEEDTEYSKVALDSFNTTGIKLRFIEYEPKDNPKSERLEIFYNTVITKLNYKNDEIFILKMTRVYEEDGESSKQNEENTSPDLQDSSFAKLGKFKADVLAKISSEEEIDGKETSSEAPSSVPEERGRVTGVPLSKRRKPSRIKIIEQKESPTSALKTKMQKTFFNYIRIEKVKKTIHNRRGQTRRGNFFRKATQLKETVKNYIKNQRKILQEGEIVPVADGEAQSVRSVSRAVASLARTEEAIYYKGDIASYRLVKALVISFIALSVILFIYFQFQGNLKFQALEDNLNVIDYSATRMFLGININRITTIVKIIESGLMKRQRYQYPDFSAALIGDYIDLARNLVDINNNIRNSLNQFSVEQQAKFYELLEVRHNDNISSLWYENVFDLSSQLASAALRLYAALPRTPSPNNPDINFILNNTLNGLLIHDEDLSSLLQEEDTSIMKSIKDLVLILLLVMMVVGILVVLGLIKSEIDFIKKKFKFFDYFLRIPEEEVDQTLSKAHNFYNYVNDKNYSEDNIMNMVEELESSKPKQTTAKTEAKPNATRHIKKKKGNFKDVNKDAWLGVVSLFLYIACFWVGYGILYLFFTRREDLIQDQKKHLIENNSVFIRLSECLTTLYIYIGADNIDNIMVRNQKLSVEWEENYKIIVQSSSSAFSELADEDFGSFSEEIRSLVSGDLCETLGKNPETCYLDGDGSKVQGIVGINNYFASVLRNIKDTYDESDKSAAMKLLIFQDSNFIELEGMFFDTVIPAYQRLRTVFNYLFTSTLNTFEGDILKINIISLLIYLIAGKLYWVTGLRRMQLEKIHFTEIMRVIPVNMIMQNKFLQNYLANNSKKILHPDG